MSAVTVRAAGHLVLTGADWRTYTRLLHAFAEYPSVRLTYDQGDLEIMSPLPEHESDADMLGRFVVPTAKLAEMAAIYNSDRDGQLTAIVAAGDSGEFYTPRPLVRMIVTAINPSTW